MLVAGSGATLGTGAFRTVSAERSFSVSTADDNAALLQLQRGDGAAADTVVAGSNTNGEGREIELDFSDKLNNEALTAFDGVLRITNNSSDDDVTITKLTFRPENADGEVGGLDEGLNVYTTAHASTVNDSGENPIKDGFRKSTDGNTLTTNEGDFGGEDAPLYPGQSVEVGFLFDTTGRSLVDDIERVVITAETDESGVES